MSPNREIEILRRMVGVLALLLYISVFFNLGGTL
jgi:hypothetical protein